MKIKERDFKHQEGLLVSEQINKFLKSIGLNASNVISITFYHSGYYQSYTLWYKE